MARSRHWRAPGEARAGDAETSGGASSWLPPWARSWRLDVLVVSDHGYSTIASVVDVEAEVRRAGFPPGEQPGGVAVAPNGGAALLYVRDGNPGVVDRLATWLAEQPWAGAPVGGHGDAGALSLLPGDAAGVAGLRAPRGLGSLRRGPAVPRAGRPPPSGQPPGIAPAG